MARLPKRTAELETEDFVRLRDEILARVASLATGPLSLNARDLPVPRLICRKVYADDGHADPIAEDYLWALVRKEYLPGGSHEELGRARRIRWHRNEAPFTRGVKNRETGEEGEHYGLVNADCTPKALTDYKSSRQVGVTVETHRAALPPSVIAGAKVTQTALGGATTRRNEFLIEVAGLQYSELLAKYAEARAENETLAESLADTRKERDRAWRYAERYQRLANESEGLAPGEEGEQPSSRPN